MVSWSEAAPPPALTLLEANLDDLTPELVATDIWTDEMVARAVPIFGQVS